MTYYCRQETVEELTVKAYDAKQSAEALQRLLLVGDLPFSLPFPPTVHQHVLYMG